MGWFEVLALLKRIAPLLGRLAPMLETLVANRVTSRTDTDVMERLSGDIRGQLAAAGEQHGDLAEAVRSQAAVLRTLTTQVERAHWADEQTELRIQQLQVSIRKLTRVIAALGGLLLVLVAVCLALLVRLLLHGTA